MIGKFLQAKRKAANLSQRQVSDRLGYSTPQFISNWERNVSTPPVPKLKQLGLLYKVPAEELFQAILAAQIEDVTQSLRRKFNSGKKAA